MISNEGLSGSMFGTGRLLDDLVEFVYSGAGCRLLLMGDTAQLPPVGEEQSPALATEALKGYGLNVIEVDLTQVVRQVQSSGILWNATQIRKLIAEDEGVWLPKIRVSGFPDMQVGRGDDLIDTLTGCYEKDGMDETIVVCRSNKRANIYNKGIRAQILYREDELNTGDLLMVAKNNYFWTEKYKEMDFIANGEIAVVRRVRRTRELYGFRFAEVLLAFPDQNDFELEANLLLDTLHSAAPALPKTENDRLFYSVLEDYVDITVKRERVEQIDESAPILVATGPLTDGKLADEIGALTGDERLHFYDAVAPIVTAESLDYNKVFAASRYGRGDADYLNCPFNKAEYEAFHAALAAAERAPLHDFDTGAEQNAQPDPDAHGKKADTVTVYEGCMPIEIMAARGADTMRFGPLRPVGLIDPRTGHRPWANVQLRAENKDRTLYNIVGFQTNLKWGEQKRVFSMIPGLENAEFVRYGVMHRNTFLDAPRVLSAQLCLKEHPNVFFAGQITGFEGYMERAACGLLAARSIYARLTGRQLPPPPVDTMCGALIQYLTTENKHFQPMGANMGILPPLPVETRPRDKRLRYMAVAERAVASFQQWLDSTSL